MDKLIATAATLAVVLVAAQDAGAHHSFAMFDRKKSVTYQGVVSVWENVNPHAYMWIYINDAKGTPQLWGLEGPARRYCCVMAWTKMASSPVTRSR